jgi:hypothetical protein
MEETKGEKFFLDLMEILAYCISYFFINQCKKILYNPFTSKKHKINKLNQLTNIFSAHTMKKKPLGNWKLIKSDVHIYPAVWESI